MNEKFFLKLLELSAAHAKRSQIIFEKLNLSNAQPKVLYILRTIDGCTQKELASVCKVTPPSMTSILNNMEKADFIYREKTLTNNGKHAHRVYLTKKGKITAEKVYSEFEKLENLCLKGFSDEEKLHVFEIFEKITENLNSRTDL
ncbi:MAG: MarR family winged helix-turn-helix transcriptional regulator [Christensenellales bacterium]